MGNDDVISTVNDVAVAPILRLPPSVRRRIYLHVGLIPEDGFYRHCVLDLHGHNKALHLRFHGLLVSCRTIYAEASDILYSSNRFNIRYWDRRSLEPLRNLTPRSLSTLTYLKIILNESSCHERHESEAYDGYMVTVDHRAIAAQGEEKDFLYGHDVPLKGNQPLAWELLADWSSTVDYLSRGISTKQLELCVVCDVDAKDITTAKRVIEPLFRLPQLKDCHLRLSRTSTPELNELTQQTALQLRGTCWPQEIHASQPHQESLEPPRREAYTRSRLLDLPREPRFRILEYTDLITPWKEVTWSRQYQAFIGVKAFCGTLDGRREECSPHVQHGCQFVDCWEKFPEPCIGCFCRVNHSAFSSTCMCWTPPQDLFLICRTLYEDSLVVFYSGNRFVVHDHDDRRPYTAPLEAYSSPCLAASMFFTDIVPEHCLRELRFVECVFPPYDPEDWPDEAALSDWSHAMSWASKRLNLPGLTIRLIMVGLDGWEDRRDMTEEQGDHVIAAYARIVAPIARLGSDGLAKFYCTLTWPWAYTEDSEAYTMDHGWEWVAAKERDLEERYGRIVIGDRYDSLHSGSAKPTDSSWVRKYIRDC